MVDSILLDFFLAAGVIYFVIESTYSLSDLVDQHVEKVKLKKLLKDFEGSWGDDQEDLIKEDKTPKKTKTKKETSK